MPVGHYFDEQPDAASRPGEVDLTLPGVHLRLATDTGVFSGGRVDPGTKYLLLEGPRPPATGHLLDLGCGYGPIAGALATWSPAATVWAVDVNERALALCAGNAAAAGLAGVRAVLPDRVPDEIRFAGIWSNPPIRVGKTAQHDLLRRWLPRLAAGAHATLVVHKNLGSDSLARWLVGQGWAVRRLGSRQGYRLLDVTAGNGPGSAPSTGDRLNA